MTFKDVVITNKPWPKTEIFGFSPAGIVARLTHIASKYAPVCYQDEKGFHGGVKPPEKGIKWPVFW
jgi:hypothetical protein